MKMSKQAAAALIIVILFALFCISVLTYKKFKKPEEPIPDPTIELVEGVLDSPELVRTDTMDSPGPIFLINTDIGHLLQVFLQRWGIVPPNMINNENKVWAYLNTDALSTLRALGAVYGYSVTVENDGKDVNFSPSEQVFESIELSLVFKNGGEAADVLWNALRDKDIQFLMVLNKTQNLGNIESGTTLSEFLVKNKLRLLETEEITIIMGEGLNSQAKNE